MNIDVSTSDNLYPLCQMIMLAGATFDLHLSGIGSVVLLIIVASIICYISVDPLLSAFGSLFYRTWMYFAL